MGEKIAQLYHSVPNVEQLQNEVYPKTLMQQMEDVKELAEKDPLTGLQKQYNCIELEMIWHYNKEDEWK